MNRISSIKKLNNIVTLRETFFNNITGKKRYYSQFFSIEG